MNFHKKYKEWEGEWGGEGKGGRERKEKGERRGGRGRDKDNNRSFKSSKSRDITCKCTGFNWCKEVKDFLRGLIRVKGNCNC